jgi:hypothetical protein
MKQVEPAMVGSAHGECGLVVEKTCGPIAEKWEVVHDALGRSRSVMGMSSWGR